MTGGPRLKIKGTRYNIKIPLHACLLNLISFILFPLCLFLLQSSESSDLSDGPITVQEFMEVKSALTASEVKIQQLLKVNCHLSEELRLMQSKVREIACN